MRGYCGEALLFRDDYLLRFFGFPHLWTEGGQNGRIRLNWEFLDKTDFRSCSKTAPAILNRSLFFIRFHPCHGCVLPLGKNRQRILRLCRNDGSKQNHTGVAAPKQYASDHCRDRSIRC